VACETEEGREGEVVSSEEEAKGFRRSSLDEGAAARSAPTAASALRATGATPLLPSRPLHASLK